MASKRIDRDTSGKQELRNSLPLSALITTQEAHITQYMLSRPRRDHAVKYENGGLVAAERRDVSRPTRQKADTGWAMRYIPSRPVERGECCSGDARYLDVCALRANWISLVTNFISRASDKYCRTLLITCGVVSRIIDLGNALVSVCGTRMASRFLSLSRCVVWGMYVRRGETLPLADHRYRSRLWDKIMLGRY